MEEVGLLEKLATLASTGGGGILVGLFASWFLQRKKSEDPDKPPKPTPMLPESSMDDLKTLMQNHRLEEATAHGAVVDNLQRLTTSVQELNTAMQTGFRELTGTIRRFEESERAMAQQQTDAQHKTALILQSLVVRLDG